MKAHTVKMAVLALVAAVTIVGPAFAGRTQAEREVAKGKPVTVTMRGCKCEACSYRAPAKPPVNPSPDPGRMPGPIE